jgi:hypothetical protein
MKKFLIKFLLFYFSYVVLWATFLLLTSDKQSYFSAIVDKHTQLEKITGPKLVIVGGSNNAFGINSTRLSKRSGKQVYNASISYFFGLDFILNDIKPYLKKGDVVLVIPEYELFYGDMVNGNIGLYTMLTSNPAGLQKLNITQEALLHEKMFVVATERIKGYVTSDKKFKSNIYSRTSFDEKGDMIAHLSEGKTNIHFKPVFIPGDFNPQSLKLLQEFMQYAKKNEVEVWMSFPCMAESAKDAVKIEAVRDSLTLHFASHLISKPEEYYFPDSLFFDDYYHLAAVGRELRTDHLIRDINKHLTQQR